MESPLLSIVTGTRNRPDSYRRFVDSVLRTVTVPFELVVGEASDCDPADSYAQPTEFIRVLYQRPRSGMIKGYNEAFRACRGEWVVWFNDDVECLAGWCDAALGFMQETPACGIGAIYFLDHNGKKPHQSKPAEEVRKLSQTARADLGWNTMFCIQTLYQLPYANFGILRREHGERWGWFDETGGRMYGSSDTHLAFTAIDDGYCVTGIPAARVLHYRERDDERNLNRHLVVEDRQAFDAKWKDKAPVLFEKHRKHQKLFSPKHID